MTYRPLTPPPGFDGANRPPIVEPPVDRNAARVADGKNNLGPRAFAPSSPPDANDDDAMGFWSGCVQWVHTLSPEQLAVLRSNIPAEPGKARSERDIACDAIAQATGALRAASHDGNASLMLDIIRDLNAARSWLRKVEL